LYEHTQRSPIVIPVVNVVSAGKQGESKNGGAKPQNQGQNQPQGPGQKPAPTPPTPEQEAELMQKRFQEMRAKLLGHDSLTE
jgi:hypothetical protein